MRISVITVNYNDQDGLQRTLESVRKQTCHDFELLVMDGVISRDAEKAFAERDLVLQELFTDN